MLFQPFSALAQQRLVREEIPGFRDSWVDMLANFKEYEVIYIAPVYTKKLKVEKDSLNLDDDDVYETEDDLKKEVGYQMRKRFVSALRTVIPAEIDHRKIADRKALVLNLSISGYSADTGLFENMLPGIEDRKAKTSIKAVLSDFASKREVLTVSDIYVSGHPESGASIFRVDDMAVWQKAWEKWAEALASFISQKRSE